MPPKKKGGKKKKKSGRKSGKKSGSQSAKSGASGSQVMPSEKMSDAGRNYFLIQIRDLEKRLVRLQRKCDELEIMNKHFANQFSQMSDDKREIADYLDKCRLQREEEITELNYQYAELRETRDKEKTDFDTQIQKITIDYNETKDQLTSENMILKSKLNSMEEYKAQREDLNEKFAQIEKEIDELTRANSNILYDAERVAVVDKDRLKKEMMERVDEVAAEFRKVSNKQMAETTKQTIRENAEINSRLQKLSEKTIELVGENDTLRLRGKDLRIEVELLDEVDKELTRKNYLTNKTIRQLVEECREHENRLEEFESEEKEEEFQQMEEDFRTLSNELIVKKREHELLQQQRQTLTERLQSDDIELRDSKRVLRRLKKLLSDTGRTLNSAKSLVDPDDEMTDAEMVQKRQGMLDALLVLLNSAANLGLGPVPKELGLQQSEPLTYSRTPSAGTRVSGSSAQTKPSRKPSETISAEKLSKFGLAPIPGNSSGLTSAQLRTLSPTTRLRRIPAISTGTQAGNPSHLLYSEKLLQELPKGAELLSKINDRASKTSGPPRSYHIPTTIF